MYTTITLVVEGTYLFSPDKCAFQRARNKGGGGGGGAGVPGGVG